MWISRKNAKNKYAYITHNFRTCKLANFMNLVRNKSAIFVSSYPDIDELRYFS